MAAIRDQSDVIELLACEIDVRPTDAPGIDALAPHVRRVGRAAGALTIEFGGAVRADVEAFAAAERLCCAGLTWEVETEEPVRLRICATPAQLDAIEAMFAAPA